MFKKLIWIVVLFLLVPSVFANTDEYIFSKAVVLQSYEVDLATDRSNSGLTGAIVGSPATATSGALVETKSLDTNDASNDDFINFSDPVFDVMPDFTFSACVNTSNIADRVYIAGRGYDGTTAGDWSCSGRSNDDFVCVFETGGTLLASGSATNYVQGAKFHFAYVVNQTGSETDIEIYLNGTLLASDGNPESIYLNTDDLHIGITNVAIGLSRSWKGFIDEAMLLNYSAQEDIQRLSDLCRDGEALEPPDTTPPEITYYNMTSEGGEGCTVWNDNKQNPCNTTDPTPTVKVKVNLSKSSYCAISTFDYNYTNMTTEDPATNCTGLPAAPGDIISCTLPDTKTFTSPGLYNISIGCKDDPYGNENRTSTSGKLLLNITDVTPPIITLEEPEPDGILFYKDRPFIFNFTATDNFGLLNLSCNIYFNNTLNDTNSSVINGTKTSFKPVNLSRDVWEWNVTCTDNSSNTNSSTRIVTINNTKPGVPILQTPANDSGFGNNPPNLPEFTWNNSVEGGDNDTITYIIEVNNQSDFAGTVAYFNSSVPEDPDGTTGVNVTLPATDEDAYYWRVTANDSFENSSSSDVFQFGYANWTITFNLTSIDTGMEIDTSSSPENIVSFDISCSNGYTAIDVENQPTVHETAIDGFSHGTHNCTFLDVEEKVGTATLNYRDNIITFTADNDKIIEVVMSRIGGMTEEEHNWLEFLYNCFNSGECIDLLRTINQTTKDIWKRVTGTDTSIVTFENITSSTLSSTSNITIKYTINIPIKEGYAVGELLPLRMFFWITDVDKTTCYNQDKSNDTNRAEAPYCLPLVAETLGPNGGEVNFTVDLRPSLPPDDYNITRSIEIDPIVNNAVRWVNYGQDNIGQIKVLESGDADLYLIKTGESIPAKTATQAVTDITGAATATAQLTTTVIGIVITLSVIIMGLLGYIIYVSKKK